MAITKARALGQYKEAMKDLAQTSNGKARLTPEQRQLLEEDEAARLELVQAREALELAFGTSGESAALARLQKAETLAPVRAKLAEPVRAIAYTPEMEHTYRGKTDRLREAKSALAWFYTQELIEKIDTSTLLPELQRTYALYRLGSNASMPWADWLESLFPQPERHDWNPLTNEARQYLDDILAKQVGTEEVTL